MPESVRADPPVFDTGRVSPPHTSPNPSANLDPQVTPAAAWDCPTSILARQTLASTRSLTRMLRKLRVSMTRCSVCISKSACPILASFHAQLTVALQEVADEWQLT